MIQVNELKVTSDNKCLIIDIQIKGLKELQNVTIDEIYLDTQDTFIETGPTEKSKKIEITPTKHVKLELSKPMIDSTKNNIYFLYIHINTDNAPELGKSNCCYKENVVLTACNQKFLYDKLINSIPEFNTCEDTTSFKDAFLQVSSIDSLLKTGHFDTVAKYWNKFMLNKTSIETKHCGCNGRY